VPDTCYKPQTEPVLSVSSPVLSRPEPAVINLDESSQIVEEKADFENQCAKNNSLEMSHKNISDNNLSTAVAELDLEASNTCATLIKDVSIPVENNSLEMSHKNISDNNLSTAVAELDLEASNTCATLIKDVSIPVENNSLEASHKNISDNNLPTAVAEFDLEANNTCATLIKDVSSPVENK
jgi:hypothetical protein